MVRSLDMALAKISVNKNLYASFMPVNFVFVIDADRKTYRKLQDFR